MPRIKFPNVPPLPGVPNVNRAVTGALTRTGILPALRGLDRYGVLDGLLGSLFGPQWGVFDKTGAAVLQPDTIVSVEYKGDEEILNHPVEAGGFASYNKVSKPSEITVVMTCSGNNGQSREDFLAALDSLKFHLDLLDIVTADYTYSGYNLVHYDYKRSAQNGVSLLTVNCRFQEVRETATIDYTETKQPDGQATQGGGTVSTTPASSSAGAAAERKAVQ